MAPGLANAFHFSEIRLAVVNERSDAIQVPREYRRDYRHGFRLFWVFSCLSQEWAGLIDDSVLTCMSNFHRFCLAAFTTTRTRTYAEHIWGEGKRNC